MPSDRSFYGGEAPVGRAGEGGVDSAGVYTGPKLYPDNAPWKCPACKVEQTGSIDEGCQSCGSGTVRPRRITTPLVPHDAKPLPGDEPGPIVRVAQRLEAQHAERISGAESIESIALRWLTSNPEATLTDAFVAGFQVAHGRMIGAPPATVDLRQYAVEGKTRRTIKAALIYFKEQILPRAIDEVATGEWTSLEEIDRLIDQFTSAEDDVAAEGEDR